MTWFVDKLGPAPKRFRSASSVQGAEQKTQPPQAQRAQPAAQAQRAAAPPPQPAPEPDKKKKKGWF